MTPGRRGGIRHGCGLRTSRRYGSLRGRNDLEPGRHHRATAELVLNVDRVVLVVARNRRRPSGAGIGRRRRRARGPFDARNRGGYQPAAVGSRTRGCGSHRRRLGVGPEHVCRSGERALAPLSPVCERLGGRTRDARRGRFALAGRRPARRAGPDCGRALGKAAARETPTSWSRCSASASSTRRAKRLAHWARSSVAPSVRRCRACTDVPGSGDLGRRAGRPRDQHIQERRLLAAPTRTCIRARGTRRLRCRSRAAH